MKSVGPGANALSAGMKIYNGKTVEFLCELSGRLLLLTGEFVLRTEPEQHRLEIHHTGRLCPSDLPLSDYVFELSDPHLRSLIPARDASARAEYFMEKPLRLRDCTTRPVVSNRAVDAPACL